MTATLARTYTRLWAPRIGPGMTDTPLSLPAGSNGPRSSAGTFDSPWMSISEVADYARTTKSNVYRHRYIGTDPVSRGAAARTRRPLYHRDDVDQWIQNGYAR